MIIKIFGGIIIIFSSGYLGYFFSYDCARRPSQLRELQGLLQMFENEICFLSNVLMEAFLKISQQSKSKMGELFGETAQILKREKPITASEAWNRALNEKAKATALNKEDQEVLYGFGKMLGNSDLEGQLKNIQLTLCQLKIQEQKAEEQRKKYEGMYKALGILGGIGMVIILF